jgi:general secretion pathway protein D
MFQITSRHRPGRLLHSAACAAVLALLGLVTIPICSAQATTSAGPQQNASSPASTPAGTDSPKPAAAAPHISSKQAHEADDAYLAGAKEVQRGNLEAAEKDFARAIQLNPNNNDYAEALLVTRGHRVTELVQKAAHARANGNTQRANDLLDEARKLAPDDPIVAQHFGPGSQLTSTVDPLRMPAQDIASTLSGGIQFTPTAGVQSFHQRADPQLLIRLVYSAYGIQATFDPSVSPAGAPVRLDVDDVDFASAQRILHKLTHTFAVPLQPRQALIAKDTQDERARLQPLVEETIYMPGVSNDVMQELANLARNVFDIKQVTANATSGNMLVRGDEDTLRLLNATFADMLDGGSDVLLDVEFYEMDTTHERNVGLLLPAAAGVFSVTAEAQQLVSANQSIINQAIASGLIKPTGNTITDLITEAAFLIATGVVNASQFGNLLGVFGNGLTLSGLYVTSGATLNLLLNSSDIRILDSVQVRAGNGQITNFRAGTRYPIITASYSSGLGSSLGSALAGLNSNGTNVSSLLSQFLAASTVTVPQFQYEDLGLTLNTTSHILRSGDINLALELKIEALGGTSLNNIPILNSRDLKSGVTVPEGKTLLLASELSNTEENSIQGLPGLNDLPGFQGTNHDAIKNTGELLITITPHIVRPQSMHIASRRLLAPAMPTAAGPGGL